MAEKKKTAKSKNALYSIYGARMSKSGERINISLVHNNDAGEKEYATCSIPLESTYVKITVKDYEVKLSIPRLDVESADEDDE